MTPDELNTNCDGIAQLLEQLRAVSASNHGSSEFQNLMAQIGLVLAGIAQEVANIKGRVDVVAERERSRDLSAQAMRVEQGMRFFAQLSEEERERLVRSVENTTPDVSLSDFAERVAKSTDVFSWGVRQLLQAVAYWYDYPPLVQDKDEDVNFVASRLADTQTDDGNLAALLMKLDANNPGSTFMLQLKRLLRSRMTLGVTSKAEALANRHERQYSYATVSTDLRPVFGNNIETSPEHAIIIHNLTIGYYAGGTTRKLCIGLSTKDIIELSSVLTRAWSKDRTLRTQPFYRILPQT